jgi:vitamin B12 transporter
VLTTRVQTLALTTRHALTPTLSLDAEAGQTRERFDDPTAPQQFGVDQGNNRVRNLAAALGWQAAPEHALQFGIESRRDHYDEPATTKDRKTDSLRVGWQGEFGRAWQVQAHARRDRSSDFGSATTGLAALAWRLAPGWKASVQASTGFSAPSFINEQYADPTIPLKPERSRQAEAALQWHEGSARVRAALFVQRQRDRIDYDDNFVAGNIARARNEGLEVMLQWPVATGAFNAELTLQNPRNADTGVALPRRSKHALVAGWSGRVESWDLRASLRVVGARRDSNYSDEITPSRTTLGFGVAREIAPGWRAALAVDNAADSKRPEVLGYTAAPRTVLLSLQATVK